MLCIHIHIYTYIHRYVLMCMHIISQVSKMALGSRSPVTRGVPLGSTGSPLGYSPIYTKIPDKELIAESNSIGLADDDYEKENDLTCMKDNNNYEQNRAYNERMIDNNKKIIEHDENREIGNNNNDGYEHKGIMIDGLNDYNDDDDDNDNNNYNNSDNDCNEKNSDNTNKGTNNNGANNDNNDIYNNNSYNKDQNDNDNTDCPPSYHDNHDISTDSTYAYVPTTAHDNHDTSTSIDNVNTHNQSVDDIPGVIENSDIPIIDKEIEAKKKLFIKKNQHRSRFLQMITSQK
jgi:hypothetical protein